MYLNLISDGDVDAQTDCKILKCQLYYTSWVLKVGDIIPETYIAFHNKNVKPLQVFNSNHSQLVH